MNYDWILHQLTTYGALAAGLMLNPLTNYAMLAAGLMLSLYLFYTVKREAGAVRKLAVAKADCLEQALRETEQKVHELEAYNNDAEGGGAGVMPRALNLTTRAKALRMHRRGESASSIAAALGSPRNEVDLLIKIHRLATRPQDQQTV